MVDMAATCRASLGLDRPRRATGRVDLGGGATAWAAPGLDLSQTPLCCALGAFDGMHLGHRSLVDAAREEAASIGGASALVTFEPDPADVLAAPEPSSHLLMGADRLRFLQSCGADVVIQIPFDAALAALSPRAFIERLAKGPLHIASAHVGTNFRFGFQGAGDITTLAALGAELGFSCHVHDLVDMDGGPVSATRIRGLLHEGQVEEAARLLGRCHFVSGSVRHGRGEGTSFGFPTANVACDPLACLPAEGVYACLLEQGGMVWPAAANVGAPPTFSDPKPAFLEANAIGFSGDLYGDDVHVVFLTWMRASRPFASLEELERVVLGNIGWVQGHVGDAGEEVMA